MLDLGLSQLERLPKGGIGAISDLDGGEFVRVEVLAAFGADMRLGRGGLVRFAFAILG